MDPGSIGWIIVVAIVIPVVVGLPVFLKHREKMAMLLGQRSDPNPELLKRISALESKCDKLQVQINEAHELIHDEQRQLDLKFAKRLESSEVKA